MGCDCLGRPDGLPDCPFLKGLPITRFALLFVLVSASAIPMISSFQDTLSN
jgi:hypothetical protein